MIINFMKKIKKNFIAKSIEKKTTIIKIFNINVNFLKIVINRDYSKLSNEKRN